MEELKFRCWHNKEEMVYFGLGNPLPDGDIMQYIGLKDRDNKEIYKGDIVELFGWGMQVKSDGMTSIVWDIDESGWNFEDSTYTEDRYDFRKAINNCKVIGNIYENN